MVCETWNVDDTVFMAERDDAVQGLLGILEKNAAELGLGLKRCECETLAQTVAGDALRERGNTQMRARSTKDATSLAPGTLAWRSADI